MKKKIAIVGHGLVPSILAEKSLKQDDNEIIIVGSLESESVKKVFEQLESEGKKITVISEEDYKHSEAMKETLYHQEVKKYMLTAPKEIGYGYGMTKKQMNQVVVPLRTEPKYQNNELCPCGSGLKYKKCCKLK